MITIFASTAYITIHNIQAICYYLQFVSLFDALHHQTWFIQIEQTGIKLSISLILRLTGELGYEGYACHWVLTKAVSSRLKMNKTKDDKPNF